MSFIQEVTDLVNETDITDAKKAITKLSSEIKKYQDRAKSYIDANYVDFLPSLNSNELLLEEGEKLFSEVDDLLETIDTDTKHDLYTATEELKQIIEEFHEVALGLKISYKILKIDTLFESLEAAKNNNEYLLVMDIIDKIKALINDPTDKIFNRLQCYQNIKIKYHIESEMLLHNLKQCFEQLIQLTEKSFQNTKSVNVRITKDHDQLRNTIIALFNAKFNPNKICNFLIANVFVPIVTKPVSVDFNDSNSTSDHVQLSLSFSLKDLSDNLRPNYKVVFNHFRTVINCLQHMNIQISDTICVFNIFGDEMKERLLNLLINECLMFSIPETMDEMNESSLVEDILEFNKFLIDCALLKEDDKELLQYAEKIGMLFRNRFCINIVDNAIEIMKKDLHDMTLMAEMNTSDVVSNNPFLFPRCMISKSTMELINLMDKILRQAANSDEDISKRLKSTIPIILKRYLETVPSHHEKLLQNIPQQTALFHNNCMFLAHWVTKNGENIEMFSTLVQSLQSLGSEHFLSQIKNQRNQLMEILQNFNLSDSISELGTEPQKIVRQCLRQLDLLKNVWQTILPDIVYNKTMNNLLNDFCLEIIRKIMALEDIPSSIASELVEICSVIIERAPTIFQDKHQVMHVATWMKLSQLKMILCGSLVQITEQWSEGKGPLTLNFKAEEIKHLIRALFQNTDRRANALASIV